jgi:hypothetical protein
LTTESLECPPSELANPKTTKLQFAVQLTTDATVHEENYWLTPTVLGHQPVDLLKVATVPAAPAATAMLFLITMLMAEAATAEVPHTGLAGEPRAEAAEATRTATPPVFHAVALMPAKKSKNHDAKIPPWQATMTASPPSLHSFAIYFSRRNSNHWGSPSTMRSKIQYSGSDATPSLMKTLVETMTRSASISPSA